MDFHGHVGPCRICRLCSDIVLVVYIYTYMFGCAANFVLQVAVGCFCLFVLCLLCSFALSRILVEKELNLLSPTTLT